MDILSHGLWAAAVTVGAKRRWETKAQPLWTALWCTFPDLFAFTVPVTISLWRRIAAPAAAHPGARPALPLDLAWQLYQVSHSLIVFAAVFGAAWLLFRRPLPAMLGWLLHILMDIPTHTDRFFPTPFLYPLSGYHASGISWTNGWFMLANCLALAAAFVLLRRTRRAGEQRDGLSGCHLPGPRYDVSRGSQRCG